MRPRSKVWFGVAVRERCWCSQHEAWRGSGFGSCRKEGRCTKRGMLHQEDFLGNVWLQKNRRLGCGGVDGICSQGDEETWQLKVRDYELSAHWRGWAGIIAFQYWNDCALGQQCRHQWFELFVRKEVVAEAGLNQLQTKSSMSCKGAKGIGYNLDTKSYGREARLCASVGQQIINQGGPRGWNWGWDTYRAAKSSCWQLACGGKPQTGAERVKVDDQRSWYWAQYWATQPSSCESAYTDRALALDYQHTALIRKCYGSRAVSITARWFKQNKGDISSSLVPSWLWVEWGSSSSKGKHQSISNWIRVEQGRLEGC